MNHILKVSVATFSVAKGLCTLALAVEPRVLALTLKPPQGICSGQPLATLCGSQGVVSLGELWET